MVAAFERVSGKTIEKKMADRRCGDIAKNIAVPTLALELLDWSACYTVDEMCRDAWNWVEKNPNGYE